jgi:hypothetical protein
VKGKSPDDLDAEAFELEARAAVLHAEAARRRARLACGTSVEWFPATDLPLPRKTILAACRSGSLRAVKRGRTWLTTRADAEGFITATRTIANDTNASTDDDVRAALGLARKAG